MPVPFYIVDIIQVTTQRTTTIMILLWMICLKDTASTYTCIGGSVRSMVHTPLVMELGVEIGQLRALATLSVVRTLHIFHLTELIHTQRFGYDYRIRGMLFTWS